MPTASRFGAICGVDLVQTGSWNASTGPVTFTRDDLAAAVAALTCPAIQKPRLKLGHIDPRFDGQPACGWVDDLRLTNGGHTLCGDFKGLPLAMVEADADGVSVLAAAYPQRSIEGVFNLTCSLDHTHPFVITAVALLGVQEPAVSTLADIASLYGVAASEAAGNVVSVVVEAALFDESKVRRDRHGKFDDKPLSISDTSLSGGTVRSGANPDGSIGVGFNTDDGPVEARLSPDGARDLAAALRDREEITIDERGGYVSLTGADDGWDLSVSTGTIHLTDTDLDTLADVVDARTGEAADHAAAATPAPDKGVDKLKLHGKVSLNPGERLVASEKVTGDRYARSNPVMALTDGPDGVGLRIGVVDHGDVRKWQAGDDGNTARFDAEGVDVVVEELDAVSGVGQIWAADMKRVYAEREAAAADKDNVDYDGLPDLDAKFGEGVIPGAEWGDLVWELHGTDDGRYGWELRLAVRPHGDDDWSFDDVSGEERDAILSPKHLDKWVARLEQLRAPAGAVAASRNRSSRMPEPAMVNVAAGVTVEDVRREWSRRSPWSMWIREIQVDPLELIVTDDETDSHARIPITVDGDRVEFGTPVPVEVQYVDKVAAAAEPAGRVVFASRAESRPERPQLPKRAQATPVAASESPAAEPVPNNPSEREDPVSTLSDQLRSRLGLPADATEEQILAAVAEPTTPTEPVTTEPAEPATEPAEPATEPATEPVTAPTQPAPTQPATPEPVAASRANDPVIVELKNELKKATGQLAEIRAARAADEKRAYFDKIVLAGKIAPADRASWEARYDKAPDVTTEILASIADYTAVPMAVAGSVGEQDPEAADAFDLDEGVMGGWATQLGIDAKELTR